MTPLPAPQGGILNRPPEHVIVAALTFKTSTPSDARASLGRLSTTLGRELTSDIDDFNAATDLATAALDSGELGPTDGFNRYHLTATLGISSSGFDKLGTPAADRPQDLIPVPWSDFADSPKISDSGDLLLQFCADDVYVVEHALRRVERELSADFTIAWALIGAQRFTSRSGRVASHEARALNGFHDGVSNLDPAHSPDDAALVFVDPTHMGYPSTPPAGQQPAGQYGQPTGPIFPSTLRPPPATEPAWTAGGSYVFVRASDFDTADWDPVTVADQQQKVGRHKYSGSPLDSPDDPASLHSEPNFTADPSGASTPLTAHIRKANPRGDGDAQRRIFRRGYPLITSPLTNGTLTRGLIFIAFGRSLSTQVEFILKAWIRNKDFPHPDAGLDAMLTFEKTVFAGGYYFVPALTHPHKPTSWALPPA